jgi:hypothetical protein
MLVSARHDQTDLTLLVKHSVGLLSTWWLSDGLSILWSGRRIGKSELAAGWMVALSDDTDPQE